MSSRSTDELRRILASAKVSTEDLLPISQEITFDANFSGADLQLLELEQEILDSFAVGDRLVIRGEDNDYAVLCTDNSTFELKHVETSNSLLILKKIFYPNDEERKQSMMGQCEDQNKNDDYSEPETLVSVTGGKQFIGNISILQITHSYYEPCKIKPNLARLLHILEPSAYNGSLADSEEIGRCNHLEPITMDILLDKVPASKREIEDYIQSNLRTIQIDGTIRLIENDYLFQALSQVLDCIDSLSWETKDIKRDVVIKELNGLHPEFILKKIFQWFFISQVNEYEAQGSSSLELYSMNKYEISRFLGEVILKTGRRFTLPDFLLAWGESVPRGLKVNLNQLEGIAVTDVESTPSIIWYFPEDSLPETITERFAILFETKSKWKLDDIMPYIQNICVSAQNASLLLTKHSRVHNVRGIKYYAAKHAK